MFTSRAYNDNYYISRKKILDDFLKEEEEETMKYIDEVEQMVSNTKLILKGLVSGELDFDGVKNMLTELETDLEQDCENINEEILELNNTDKNIEESTKELQITEEKGNKSYFEKIEELKKELEIKEFKIQNMERLYVDLENIIKENIRLGNEQLLSLDQFAEFVQQNDGLKYECDKLEFEKRNLIEEYNNVLRENVNLRSKDESFEFEKVKDALEEISMLGYLHKEAESRINKLQEKFKELNKEGANLTNQIKTITKNLESLNIDNHKLNRELKSINRELCPTWKKLNKSFSENTVYNNFLMSELKEDEIDAICRDYFRNKK
jgi:DNA repair exonuclease SbcCD ATPase subunit